MEAMRFDAKAYLLGRREPTFYDYPSMMMPEKRELMTDADRLIGWERK